MKNIISAPELHELLQNEKLIILDASQPGNKAGLVASNPDLQIKGARTFDIKNDFSDTSSSLPNMLQDEQNFEKAVQALGINQDSILVAYDNLGIFTSPRAWWMFKTMGYNNISVLNGGLDAWIDKGFPTEAIGTSQVFDKGNFKASFNKNAVVDAKYVYENVNKSTDQVIDARGKQRFDGTVEEPRPGMRSGHIPNSQNLPFKKLLENGFYKSIEKRKEIFDQLNLDQEKPLIFSCGSGITAVVDLLGAEDILPQEKKVYDGSWTEWGQSKYPIATNKD
ncbi:sulfurtransferase [Flammeovirga agarivorans]|uniref:Sulfurtransferase n=1 Tax=Flammeovirga agarivorans TaxID=2726742 RepID=A0A7X8SNY8_9BACT|nr:sulfurtransferase [Flammeovirga agarivorans]NLR93719.1 sulfurtransferase [Flammeovirga agarivorans]